MFTYNNALGQFCYTNDNGGGAGGGDDNNGGGGGDNGNGGGNNRQQNRGNQQQQQQADPPWKAEFGDTFDPDRAWETIKTLRGNERTLKRERDDAQGKLRTRDDADKTELEKATTLISEMQGKLDVLTRKERDAILRVAVAEVAKKNNAYVPEDIYALISSDLEVDDDGKPKNAETLVKALKAARPQYFGKQGVDARTQQQQNGNQTNVDWNTGVRALFGR